MSEKTIVNAEISSTFLGYEDHGIFTLYLSLNMSGSGISIGGYSLDEWNGKQRVGTAMGMELMIQLLNVVGVKTWEELKGQYIRVVSNGLGRRITKIGNLMKDEWLDLEEFFAEQSKGDE